MSDKTLTIVSLLFAAASGVALLPLSLIAAREVIVIGARIVTVDNEPLLPSNRVFGGVLAFLLWTNTLLLAISDRDALALVRASIAYWVCAVLLSANLVFRLRASVQRIKAALSSIAEE